jgi:hypothetical protein
MRCGYTGVCTPKSVVMDDRPVHSRGLPYELGLSKAFHGLRIGKQTIRLYVSSTRLGHLSQH